MAERAALEHPTGVALLQLRLVSAVSQGVAAPWGGPAQAIMTNQKEQLSRAQAEVDKLTLDQVREEMEEVDEASRANRSWLTSAVCRCTGRAPTARSRTSP